MQQSADVKNKRTGKESFPPWEEQADEIVRVVIGAGITNVSHDGVYDFKNLEVIEVEAGNPYCVCVDGVLYTADMKTLLTYPSKRAGESYEIPEGVERIDGEAFYDVDELKSVFIPASVNRIESNSFYREYELESVGVAEGNTSFSSESGVLFDKEKTRLILYPCSRAGQTYAIPGTVTVIGEGAFEGNRKLKTISIPDGVTTIEERAFSGSHPTEVTVPASVTFIGKEAFGLIMFGKPVFRLEASVEEIGSLTFAFLNTEEIALPEGVEIIRDRAFTGAKLTSVTLPSTIRTIEGGAFFSCDELTDVYFNGTEAEWAAVDNLDAGYDDDKEIWANVTVHFLR